MDVLLKAALVDRPRLEPAQQDAVSGFSRMREFLCNRSSVSVIVVGALILCAPALMTGLILDDNFHAIALRTELSTPETKRAPWDAFSFARSPADGQALMEDSTLPWWSDPQARLAFFRPLTSLTLWVDQNYWPGSPELMHMQSLLWYAILLCVIAHVYRRFAMQAFGFGFPGLALLLFSIDDAHAMTVGWIANRSALMALTFGFASLLAHDSWRTRGQRRHLLGSLSLSVLGLFCAETEFQVTAYFLAYALFIDTSSRPSRWLALAPTVSLHLAWLCVYSLLGFGAYGSETYIDPAREPLAFVNAASTRLPLLLAAQLAGLSADLGDSLHYWAPSLLPLLVPTALVGVALCGWALYPLWSTQREVRFWAVGMLLSTLPVCAAPPADRLLMATGLGGSALVAILERIS